MPCGFVYSLTELRVSVYPSAVLYICVRSLHVCSFDSNGQYQSLRLWNEKTVRHPRFFVLSQTEFQNAVCQRVP